MTAAPPFPVRNDWTAEDLLVLTPDKRNVRCPDIVVFQLDEPERIVRADQVALVVEVVSPSTKTQDRVMKPVQYAEAGIPCYWRAETKPGLSVAEYQLTELGKYYEHSPRAGVFTVDKPWPIEIDLDAVTREAGLR